MIGVDHFHHKADRWRPMVEAVVSDFPGRARVLGTSTAEASTSVADGSVDFVFIDAGHSYQAVAQDIRLWRPKLRPGGWLGGHDYCDKFPGVKQAVREACGSAFDLLPGDIWEAR
jgi:predicted O-methyltransferase YrrM